jgi:hypothetical protein
MSSTYTSCSIRARRPPLQISLNNLTKRIKRVGFGLTCFKNYRIRVLLYAGQPN